MQHLEGIDVYRRVSAASIAIIFSIATVVSAMVPIFLSQSVHAATNTVVINEVDPHNDTVELYNMSDENVSLKDWKIYEYVPSTGDRKNSPKIINDTITANGYLKVIVDDINNSVGDRIQLIRENGSEDTVTFGEVKNSSSMITFPPEEKSVQRNGDGGMPWFVAEPTLGKQNHRIPLSGHAFTATGSVSRYADTCEGDSTCPARTSDVLAGWTIHMYEEASNGTWTRIASTNTNAEGNYTFEPLTAPGIYHVCEVLQSGWEQVTQTDDLPMSTTENKSGETNEGPLCHSKVYLGLGDESWSVEFGNIDTEAPTTSHDLPAVINGRSRTITQTITDNYQPASGKLRIWKLDENGARDDTKFYASAETSVDETDTIEYVLNPQANLFGDGTYLAKFTATDRASLSTGKEQRFVLDTVKPVITEAKLSDNILNADDNDPTITATVRDTATPVINAQYRIHTADGQIIEDLSWVNFEAIDGSFNATTENITQILDTSRLIDGSYIVRVRAFDSANNKKSGVDIPFSIDRTAPTATIGTLPSSNEKLTLHGTVNDANAAVTVTLGGNTYVASVNSEPNADSTHTWTVYIAGPLTPGTYTVTAQAIDDARNISVASVLMDLGWVASLTTTAPLGTSAQTNQKPPGLIATPFNTTDPKMLGVTTPAPGVDSEPKKEPQVESLSITQNEPENEEEKQLVEAASESAAWYWVMTFAALMIVAFFAYRNWRSYPTKN